MATPIWVTVGAGSSPESSILWSTDGRNWHDASSGGFTDGSGLYRGSSVAYGNGIWVSAGRSSSPTSSILWSTDGRKWYDASSGGFTINDGVYSGGSVAYGSGTWVAVGAGSSPTSSILWSTNGRTWHDAYSGGFYAYTVYKTFIVGRGVYYDGIGKWVAVGYGNTPTSTIKWSTDGRNWHDASSGGFPLLNGGNSVAYGNGVWVAVGYGSSPTSSIQWSTDGYNWHDALSGGFNNGIGFGTGIGIAYGNHTWVAVGQGTSPESGILWSTDGYNWHDALSGGFDTFPPYGLTNGLNVYYNGIAWVAVGSGYTLASTILWSLDGKTWQEASSGGFSGYVGTPTTITTTVPPTTTTTTVPPLPKIPVNVRFPNRYTGGYDSSTVTDKLRWATIANFKQMQSKPNRNTDMGGAVAIAKKAAVGCLKNSPS